MRNSGGKSIKELIGRADLVVNLCSIHCTFSLRVPVYETVRLKRFEAAYVVLISISISGSVTACSCLLIRVRENVVRAYNSSIHAKYRGSTINAKFPVIHRPPHVIPFYTCTL